jgi:AcrR family transcriptional regulator
MSAADWPRPAALCDRDSNPLQSVAVEAERFPEHSDLATRARILDTAYALFSSRGVRGVSLDEVASGAEMEHSALTKHFRTKDELMLAFLELREEVWTKEFVEAEARRRGTNPEERLLAIFDIFDEWFRREDFEGCSFINVMFEMQDDPAAKAVCVGYLANIRSVVAQLAEEAELRDPAAFAYSWHILMKGSIVQAAEGDLHAAQRAKALARMLIETYRPVGLHAVADLPPLG